MKDAPAVRVLHLYGGNLYGGVERALALLAANAGAAPQLRQEFGLVYDGRLRRELSAAAATLYSLGPARLSRPWQVWRARRRLATHLRAHPVDAVVCHAWWSYGMFAPAARTRSIPVALWAHDALAQPGWLENWAARHPPGLLIANSLYTASTLPRLFPGVPVEVLHYPVALSTAESGARARLRDRYHTANDSTVILQLSRLERWKGQHLHLEALALLANRSDWTAWISGWAQRPKEQTYLRELKEFTDRRGIADRLRWLPEQTQVGELMSAADIFCHPNTGPEPFGIVFVEALGAALPVVATAMGGALEILANNHGLLTDPTPAAVAAALETLLTDPSKRRRLGSLGPDRARALCDPPQRTRDLAGVIARHFPAAVPGIA